jgi:hypothetical protein
MIQWPPSVRTPAQSSLQPFLRPGLILQSLASDPPKLTIRQSRHLRLD